MENLSEHPDRVNKMVVITTALKLLHGFGSYSANQNAGMESFDLKTKNLSS